jgi:hypothetical protein
MFETPVHLLQANFARGEVSPYLFGRVDLTAYSSGLRTLRNAFVRPEGPVSNRPGFKYLGNSITAVSKASALLPFVFSATQSYVIEVGALTAQVFSNGALVIGATFVTPWAAADLPRLRFAQSTDTLTVVHPNYPPYEIKRTSASSFTCLQAAYINGPFLPQNTDGTTFVYASAITGTVTLTASSPIFNANQVGGLMQLTQQDLSLIPPWEPSKLFTDTAGNKVTPVGMYRRASLKNYKCVAIGAAFPANGCATGTWIPSHSQGTQTDGDGSTIPSLAAICGVSWQYQDSGYGVVLITAFTSSTQVTAVVQPNYVGGPSLLPLTCVGGPVTVFGPFTFTATANQTAFTPLTGVTSTDPTKFFVTVNGAYQAPSSYSVTGTTLTFLAGQAAGATVVIRQISQLGQTTYWNFGAFSTDQGYPSAVSYIPDRLVLAATPKQPVGVFGSQTSQYHNFQVSSPVVASDAFAVFLNARQLNAISDLIPLSDLLIGTSNIIWRLWPGSTGTALGPLAIKADPQNYYGENQNCASVLFGDSAIFAEYDGRRLRDLIYQFAYDKFKGDELTLYSRHLIPFGTQLTRLAYKPDPAGQMLFCLRSDGALLVCTYLKEQQVTGWAHWDTSGTFEDICVVPENTSFALYALINRTINGVAQRYVERLSSREVKSVYDYQFLDCNLTYDGRNTSATTMTLSGGTTWLAGDTVTLTASGTTGWATFFTTDVGNEIWIYDAAGARCRLLITARTSTTVVTVQMKDPCPVTLQALATAVWTFARTKFTGATQIAGMSAVALVDATTLGINATGIVPNGQVTIALDGSITLPAAGGVVQIGLPYLSDFETLSLNAQGQETIRMRAKSNPVIYLDCTETRNFIAGTDFVTMYPSEQRAFETYTSPINLQEGVLWTRIPSTLDAECHTCVRQNMPLPITIRMHIPQVTIGAPVA